MVRRRSTAHELPDWMTSFVPEGWDGACDVERFDNWRSAVIAQTRSFLDVAPLLRTTRRRMELSHVECRAHPALTCWPAAWLRHGDQTRFEVAWSDGSSTMEEVQTGSDRDRELMDADRARRACPPPSHPAQTDS